MRAKGNPAAGNCGARDIVCLQANSPENSRIERPPQAQSARLRRQRLVESLHRLGPSPLFHFLDEIENGASIPDRLEVYSRLPADFIKALGGDRFAPVLHAIEDAS